MSAIQRISERRALVDLVAFDRDGRPVLIVAATGQEVRPIFLAAYLEILGAIRRDIPFAILADPERMTIYRKDRTWSVSPVAAISTGEILDFYGSPPGVGRDSKNYIIGMTDAWLRDFNWHWKSPTPPASETMTDLGLATRLARGRTRRRVRIACLPVRGDQLPIELRDGEEYWDRLDRQRKAQLPPADSA